MILDILEAALERRGKFGAFFQKWKRRNTSSAEEYEKASKCPDDYGSLQSMTASYAHGWLQEAIDRVGWLVYLRYSVIQSS